MQIKDLKVEDVIKDKDGYFCKVLDKTDNLVAVSNYWRETYTKEKIETNPKNYSTHYTEYDLKDYTLVTLEWNANKLKAMDAYYYISSTGQSSIAYWRNDKLDIFRLKAGLIYQTKKLAQKAIDDINNK